MGAAKVLFENGKSLICNREGSDDREVADQLLDEVRQRHPTNGKDRFIYCDNGGGFDAHSVVGITVDEKDERKGDMPESVSDEL